MPVGVSKHVAATSLMILALGEALAQSPQSPPTSPPPWHWGPGPWHMWSGGHFWWMPLSMMFMLIVVAVLLYLLVGRRMCGWGGHHAGPPASGTERGAGSLADSALRILNERFARGEIDKNEYQDRKSVILSASEPNPR